MSVRVDAIDGSIQSPFLGAFWCGVAFLAVRATRATLTAWLTRFTPNFAWFTRFTRLTGFARCSLVSVHRAVATTFSGGALATLTVAATATPFAATASAALTRSFLAASILGDIRA